MININHLNKFYNKKKKNEIHVINDACLELPSKGLVTFLGPSGSGKTTLLNAIGGLDKSTGEITYDHLKIKNYRMHKIDMYRREEIGYIFQNYNLLPNRTVLENLEIALEMMNVVDPEEVQRRIEYTLKAVKMYKYRKKLAYALSGGQQQRVAIARALLKRAKIYIADEPTGNLDSENTIEVMNILKKISKTSLVLLVTHNINIAKFYSDQIIEIRDGKIISISDNISNSTLARSDVNTVYLKDMKFQEANTPLGKIAIYKDEDDDIDMDIELIIRNHNVYIKANRPLHLVENSNLNLVNEHYQDLNMETVDETVFDTSWFEKKEITFKQRVAKIFKELWESMKSFFRGGKKQRFIHIAFFFIGLVLGTSIICMINFATPDTSNFIYTDSTYQINSKNHIFTQDPIVNIADNYDAGKIGNVSLYLPQVSLGWEKQMSYNKRIKHSVKVTVGLFNERYSILYGHAPENHKEVVIDRATADELRKLIGVGATYEDLMGESINLHHSKNFAKAKICGVVNGCQYAALGTKELYTHWASPIEENFFGNIRLFDKEVDQNGEYVYTVVDGRNVTTFDEEERNYEVLIKKNGEYENYKQIQIDGIDYDVVGSFEYSDWYEIEPNELIVNIKRRSNNKRVDMLAFNPWEYRILEGREPKGLNECIVSVYSNLPIGGKIQSEFGVIEVVGVYNGTTEALSSYMIVNQESYIIRKYSYDAIAFDIFDKDLSLSENEEAIALFDTLKKISLDNQESNLFLFELLSLVLLIISSIFIYFTMRSKMISQIYSIGVYRSLGASRSKIVLSHLRETFVMLTFTSLLGYLVMLFIYDNSASLINNILKQNMFRINNGLFLLGVLVVYILALLIGTLPIILLLRKTPSEICSKYDI